MAGEDDRFGVARPNRAYNIYFEYGQSNREGVEAWPALSTTPQDGNFMLGEDIRSAVLQETFVPVGGPTLHPLIARTVLSRGKPVSRQAEAELARGSQARGETPGVAAMNYLQRALGRSAAAGVPRPAIVLGNGAVGATSIDGLRRQSPTGVTTHYQRYLSYLETVTACMRARGESSHLFGIGFAQGESDYLGEGSCRNRLDYGQELRRLHADMCADAMRIAGNDRPPGFFIWQVGGAYTVDKDRDGRSDLFIGMAIWDFARETPGVWLVGPLYPYPDKRFHLDANGARWAGLKEGQVLDLVLNHQVDWRPLAPVAVEAAGDVVDIHYHVPEPPLRFAPVHHDGELRMFRTKGFRVSDSRGSIQVNEAAIVAPTTVRLSLERQLRDRPICWYADKEGYFPEREAFHRGMGNLCDSDPTRPEEVYEFLGEAGMYPTANIPSLVGRPYDLANWAIAHCLPIGWAQD
jgi:hypothetical protein